MTSSPGDVPDDAWRPETIQYEDDLFSLAELTHLEDVEEDEFDEFDEFGEDDLDGYRPSFVSCRRFLPSIVFDPRGLTACAGRGPKTMKGRSTPEKKARKCHSQGRNRGAASPRVFSFEGPPPNLLTKQHPRRSQLRVCFRALKQGE